MQTYPYICRRWLATEAARRVGKRRAITETMVFMLFLAVVFSGVVAAEVSWRDRHLDRFWPTVITLLFLGVVVWLLLAAWRYLHQRRRETRMLAILQQPEPAQRLRIQAGALELMMQGLESCPKRQRPAYLLTLGVVEAHMNQLYADCEQAGMSDAVLKTIARP